MDNMAETIARNLQHLRQSIATAAHAAGRHPQEIRLIAVSKAHPPEAIRAAVAARQLEFGESTVQEALAKIPHVSNYGVIWHFVGALQSNKAKFVPGRFHWVHSLDSARLAERLERFAREAGAILHALIEVNVTGDPRKHGVAPAALDPLLEQLLAAGHRNVVLRGLMTIGPYPARESEIRACYAQLRQLRDECRSRFKLRDFTELSMGMSGDYVEAIKEGATMVRIGTAIFGQRDPSRPTTASDG